MKLMIASDIHGSAFYCAKLLDSYKKLNPDKLLLLGDILYHGPRNDLPKDYSPKDVFSMLNPLKDNIIAVRGNCDSEVDQMVLEFPMMADYTTVMADGNIIFATHGHIYNEENLPKMSKGTILLNGHTHLQLCHQYDDYLFLNPGSVSIPKDGTYGFMVIDGKDITWYDIEGNIKSKYIKD